MADYKRFTEFAKSPELARYYELKKTVESDAFKAKVKKLKEEKFSDTEAYAKWQEYKSLKSSSDMAAYIKFTGKQLDQKLKSALDSSNYKRYTELQAKVETPAFSQKAAAKDFKQTEDYQLLTEYKRLSKSSEVKFAKKTQASSQYQAYKSVLGSDKLKKYEALDAYINSQEFIQYKKEMEDSKRFQKSPEYATIQEYEKLAKQKDVAWYLKSLETNAFADLQQWQLTFSDEFDQSSLDAKKWMVGYYWGAALMNDTYSLADELQMFKKQNVSIAESAATITTKAEQAKGKRWTTDCGFVESDFGYTSSLINTGGSFRQQYGRFDFKVKLSFDKPLTHNIWMVGERSTPQINVLSFGSTNKKELTVGVATQGGTKTSVVDGADFSNGYYIYSLQWTPEKIAWSVNGVEVASINANIPKEPMYIVLSSNLNKEGSINGGAMSVDWVRCYAPAKKD